MELWFGVVHNTVDEISMGHKLWFELFPGSDAVSGTANASGFTPHRSQKVFTGTTTL